MASNRINSASVDLDYWKLSASLAIGCIAPSLAYAVTPATTQVSKYCLARAGGDYQEDQQSYLAQPYPQATNCDLYASGTYNYEPVSSHVQGYANAGFGPGIPQIGIVTTSAQASTYNYIAEADLGASTQFSFEIQPIGTPPGPLPSMIPILFSAHGEGHTWRSGYGSARAQGFAHLYGSPLAYNDGLFTFDVQVVDETAYDPVDTESMGGGFDGTKFLNLYLNYAYGVVISATCSNWVGPVGQSAAASTDCFSQVDPSIAFDQATFDAQMGENTYQLDQYYQFAFSPNLPVPEPENWAMLLAGLGMVGFAVKRRKG